VARGKERAELALPTIAEAAPGVDAGYLLGDLGELDQVRALAAEFTAGHGRLDVLVHDAGALLMHYRATSTGNEVTVASQVAGPYLLTGLLLALLRASAPSRVIQVSSGGMYTERYELDKLEMEPSVYDGTVAYARAKRAQLVLMNEWARRSTGSGVVFHAMNPGWADTPRGPHRPSRVLQGHAPAAPVLGGRGRHRGVARRGTGGRGHRRPVPVGPTPPLGEHGLVPAQPQPSKPYCWWGPITAHSNMPNPTWSPQVKRAAYSVRPQLE